MGGISAAPARKQGPFSKIADDKDFAKGLEDVIAGESSICDVDGKNGKLIYRGYDIHHLAQHTTFEEVVYLLWNGDLPTASQLSALQTELDAVRALPEAAVVLLRRFPKTAPPMDALRTAASLLPLYDPDEGEGAVASAKLDLSGPDRADPDALNAILWHALKPGVPVPAPVRSARWESVNP